MDADKLRLNVILLQDELAQVRAGYAADYDTARARNAADKAHRIAEDESLNRIQPDSGERAQARWQGEGGGPAEEQAHPLASIYPD
ncbi:hypothetical protein [Rubellimicrobium mesophilum]|uniref:hypothetical protein n=1 Tax=Rubellimicrobium mesophilum TaxID=1123067 RepID=UPI000561905E|nr:hypothetical protein [Rubellimicrobium mesophilum]